MQQLNEKTFEVIACAVCQVDPAEAMRGLDANKETLLETFENIKRINEWCNKAIKALTARDDTDILWPIYVEKKVSGNE